MLAGRGSVRRPSHRVGAVRPLSARLREAFGVWRSLVARFVRDEEAVGSNPATPTKWGDRHSAGRPFGLSGAKSG